MNLKIFLSALLVYRHNFQVIHWMAKGESFLTIHDKTQEYYTGLTNDIDTVAEMILRTEDSIVNYKEAMENIEDYDYNFLLMHGSTSCDMECFVEFSTKMFKDLMYCITKVLEDEHSIGIKSGLESLYDKYELQCNYILKRLKK